MHTRRALVVEDDPGALKLLARILDRMGFEVATAEDGREALRRLEEGPLDLVCLDLGLPTISGFDVCAAIRKHPATQALPILITSGRWLPQDRALAQSLGCNGYLVKPFTPSQFKAAVRELTPDPGPMPATAAH